MGFEVYSRYDQLYKQATRIDGVVKRLNAFLRGLPVSIELLNDPVILLYLLIYI